MKARFIPIWKIAPFLRLFVALISGIFLQWSFKFSTAAYWVAIGISLIGIFSFFFLNTKIIYRLRWLNGLFAFFLLMAIGALLITNQDIRNNKNWLGNTNPNNSFLAVTLQEPPIEKPKSFKAVSEALFTIDGTEARPIKGKLIIYFKKDSSCSKLSYGSLIIFKKTLQEIKNINNPGSFNYKQYSLFQGITHQVYLAPSDYTLLQNKKTSALNDFIFSCRDWVLKTMHHYISREKERGLAEALLIGYKNDLEESLVQSYSNTGVVHVIAISGLHLGLIYLLLIRILKPLSKTKKLKWLPPIIIIASLWLFSLLAGAQPSVLRSAVMFTCLVIGNSIDRQSSIYNSLAFSAFLLLCINPFWLWDVGFQLSYAAVLSIVIFMKPIYNLLYFPNKLLNFLWQMVAVTLAAQILTTPISIYHFHQFPNYFLLTNFVAVPLSSIILIGELLLCTLSFIPPVALFIGKIIQWLIWLMNSYVEKIEALPFSLWDKLQINAVQCFLLIGFAAGIGYWLLKKAQLGLQMGLCSLLFFCSINAYSFWIASNQKKIIVYNVPKKQAVDFVSGNNFSFIGDSILLENGFEHNFYLKPSRVLYRLSEKNNLDELNHYGNAILFGSKRILLLSNRTHYRNADSTLDIDLAVVSKNTRVTIKTLLQTFNIKQIVLDGTMSPWKISRWQKDCDSLHIPFHDVNSKGAFVMPL